MTVPTFDEPTATTSPSIKLRTKGATAVFYLADIEEIAVYDDKTGEQKKSAKGWAHVQKRFTGLLKSHTDGAAAGTLDEPETPVDGDQYSFYSGVGGFFAWKDAVGAFAAEHGRSPAVGDVIRWTLDKIEKPTQAGFSGKKITSYTIKPADDPAMTARCEAIYWDRKNGPAITLADADAKPYDPAEEPF